MWEVQRGIFGEEEENVRESKRERVRVSAREGLVLRRLNHRSLVQNSVSFIGILCKRDLSFVSMLCRTRGASFAVCGLLLQ